MSNLGLPNITVTFSELANSAVRSLNAQTVAACLIAESASLTIITKSSEIPSTLTEASKSYIKRIFEGSYGKAPSKVIISANTTLALALTALEPYSVDWVCANNTTEEDDDDFYADLTAWITSQRTDGKFYKAVVSGTAANSDYVVNLTTDSIVLNDSTILSSSEYTGRIAGILASLPLSQSCTYFMLDDCSSVPHITKASAGSAIAAGELILINDGEVVRIARGVTSATGESAKKKIKLVTAMDKVEQEIKTAIKTAYVGRYAGTYDNKCLLIAALKSYFAQLTKNGVIAAEATVEIDVNAQETYLSETMSIDTSSMTAQEIKEANTGDEVFISISISFMDAMENFTIAITC